MDYLDRSLPVIEDDDDDHSLLKDPPLPEYTEVTLRRAFASWLHIGHTTLYRTLCDYYHRLEAWEETLPPTRRAQSRYLEFNLLTNGPPTSSYQKELFPNLYAHSHSQSGRVVNLQAMTNQNGISKLDEFLNIAEYNTESNKDPHSAYRAIRTYCKNKSMPLKTFLKNFLIFVTKCNLDSDITNMIRYINLKNIDSEIQTINNCQKSFNFLEFDEGTSVKKKEVAEVAVSNLKNTDSEIQTINNCQKSFNFLEFDEGTSVKKKEVAVSTASSFQDYFHTFENKGKYNNMNKSTADFFESFSNNKQMKAGDNVSYWIYDTYNYITKKDKNKSSSSENLQVEDVSKDMSERWCLLKSMMNAKENNKYQVL